MASLLQNSERTSTPQTWIHQQSRSVRLEHKQSASGKHQGDAQRNGHKLEVVLGHQGWRSTEHDYKLEVGYPWQGQLAPIP